MLERRFKRYRFRAKRGTVIPLVAFSAICFLAAVAFIVDLGRDFLASGQLYYAAQSAALFGYAYATNDDGSYDHSSAQNNISTRVLSSSGLNQAPSGPSSTNSKWQSTVNFDPGDITFSDNPDDPGEIILTVTAKRTTNDALKAFFLPALFAMNSQAVAQPNSSVSTLKLSRKCEVIGQPASRVGPGAPLDTNSDPVSQSFVGFAALPIAISNQEFAPAAQSAQPLTTYVIDCVPSTSGNYGSTPPAGHFVGAFVNLSKSNNGLQYYAGAGGDLSIDQLEAQLNYFLPSPSQNAVPPVLVERGSVIAGYDPADSAFQSRQSEIAQLLTLLPLNRDYIVPVISSYPAYAISNQVVGFARLKLLNAQLLPSGAFSLTVSLDESVPVRNTACSNDLSTVSADPTQLMPPPVPPFTSRRVGPTGGIAPRPWGVILSPSPSPRVIGF